MNIKGLQINKTPAFSEGQYTALATDKEGNEYILYWDILKEEDVEGLLNGTVDPAIACNWQNPIAIHKRHLPEYFITYYPQN